MAYMDTSAKLNQLCEQDPEIDTTLKHTLLGMGTVAALTAGLLIKQRLTIRKLKKDRT
jgi:hypothetical protein